MHSFYDLSPILHHFSITLCQHHVLPNVEHAPRPRHQASEEGRGQEKLLNQITEATYPIIRDRPTFRGVENGISFEEWAYKINAKIQIFPVKDVDNKARILYLANHTAEKPFDIIKAHLPVDPVSFRGRDYRKVYIATQELLTDLQKRHMPIREECTVQ